MNQDDQGQHLDSFSALERHFLGRSRSAVLTALGPAVRMLDYLHVPPNLISSFQILGGIGFFFIVVPYPRQAFLLFIFTLFLDAIDGSLARLAHKQSRFGALVDQFCDHTREVLVIAALATAGLVNVGLAVLYAFVYPAFNFTLFLTNYFRAPVPFAIKSFLVVYPAIFSQLWFGVNWLDTAVAASISLMVLVILMGLNNLRNALREAQSV